jgi:hypothetical protein
MSRVTLTGLFVIAATTAALAQPAPPVPVPKPDAEPFHYIKPDLDFEGLSKIDFEGLRKIDFEGLKFDVQGLQKIDAEGLKKLDVEMKKLDIELKKIDVEGLKALAWEMDGLKDLEWDTDSRKPFKVFDGKRFDFANKNQGDLARLFERCDERRGRGDAGEQEERSYDCGRRAIDESQWDRAVEYFTQAANVKGNRADGALYWKAYSQNRLGQRAEALTTLAELKNGYAKSRWTNDANALEVEVRQRAGQKVDPANTSDDELKLIALNALGDSPDAVPMLERMLAGPQSPKLKERALFVLAQNQNPAARAVVVKIAKGGGNPELQLRAIQYVGRTRTPESREVLSQAYTTTTEPGVKRMIIRTYMESQDRERLLALARTETDPALRMEAVRQLGNMRAGAELSELYLRETSPEVKKQILRGMANGGSIDRLIALVESEKDPELKRTAIRTIGVNRDTGPQLLNFYQKDTNQDVRKAVIDALFTQGNATALVNIARKETDIELRKNLVNRLGNMRDNAEAKAFLLELLK